MTQIKSWLRRLFIIFSIGFVVAGAFTIIISLALLSPSSDSLLGGDESEVQSVSHIILFIIGSVIMFIGILGTYGAHKENLLALTVYLVCVVTGSVLMLRVGIPVATARPNLERLVEERWRSRLPLDHASDDTKKQVEALQTSLRCCGLFSYKDWGDNIPDSCLCNQEDELEEKCQRVSYTNFMLNLFWQKKSVFTQLCFPLIMESVTTKANVTLGVVFTLFTMVLLGSLLSSLMIYQKFTSNKPNPLLPVPVMFIDRPPAYHQLCNLPE